MTFSVVGISSRDYFSKIANIFFFIFLIIFKLQRLIYEAFVLKIKKIISQIIINEFINWQINKFWVKLFKKLDF